MQQLCKHPVDLMLRLFDDHCFVITLRKKEEKVSEQAAVHRAQLFCVSTYLGIGAHLLS